MRPGVAFVSALFAALLASSAAWAANDDDMGERTNEVISTIAADLKVLELSDVPSDLNLSADTLEFELESRRLLCRGNVVVTQGDTKLEADTLTVTGAAPPKRTGRKIQAVGNVRISRGTERASGELADYNQDQATFVLSGNAALGSGESSVRGETVVFHIDEGHAVIVGGDEPVKAVIEIEALPEEEDE